MMSKRFAVVAAIALAVGSVLALAPAAPRAMAQAAKPTTRTVEGSVVNKDGKPVENAVVYIKDTKSLAIKSYLTDSKGYFHFNQLSLSNDYEVWAELNGQKSKTKSISMFNSKPNLSYDLKLSE